MPCWIGHCRHTPQFWTCPKIEWYSTTLSKPETITNKGANAKADRRSREHSIFSPKMAILRSSTIKSNWRLRRKGKTILYPLESYGSINRRPATTRFHLLTNSHIHMTDVGKFNVSCLYIWNLCPPPCFSLEMASVGGSSGALIHSPAASLLSALALLPSLHTCNFSSHPFTLATLHLVPALLLPFPFPYSLLSCL